MSFDPDLKAHLALGTTTLARCWRVHRKDGQVLGFTDHDLDLTFEGTTFRADSGLSASALQNATGLSVDNTEAFGALRSDSVTSADIAAGLYDDAEIEAFLVNWSDPSTRQRVFRGTLGEITREGDAFRAEIRGLTEKLNKPIGRVFQKPCTAVLGDAQCRVDFSAPQFSWQAALLEIDGAVLTLPAAPQFEEGWFQRGALKIITGSSAGLSAVIKSDVTGPSTRRIELWSDPAAALAVGDTLELVAGCDKRFETCRQKFSNALNFQGFPDVPEEDWVLVHPSSQRDTSGGSRR